MAPRLRLLLLLLPAAPAQRPHGRATRGAGPGQRQPRRHGAAGARHASADRPPPDTPPSGDAIAWPHRPARPGGPRAAAQLLGVGPGELRRLLGEPTLRRAEGTAEVWLYAGGGCALDLILYPAARGGLRVAHAAARANGAEARTEAACLGEIAGVPQDTPRAGSGA
ncbi:hypothetical protein ACFQU2_11525 [Siccirubricoccus deserti]